MLPGYSMFYSGLQGAGLDYRYKKQPLLSYIYSPSPAKLTREAYVDLAPKDIREY